MIANHAPGARRPPPHGKTSDFILSRVCFIESSFKAKSGALDLATSSVYETLRRSLTHKLPEKMSRMPRH